MIDGPGSIYIIQRTNEELGKRAANIRIAPPAFLRLPAALFAWPHPAHEGRLFHPGIGVLLSYWASTAELVAGATTPEVQDASNIGAMMVAETEHETA